MINNHLIYATLMFHRGEKGKEAQWVSRFGKPALTVIPCSCCNPGLNDIITSTNRSIDIALERVDKFDGTSFYFAHPHITQVHHYDIPWQTGEIITRDDTKLQIIFLGSLGSAGSASCYLVTDGIDAFLIDCGMTVGRLDNINDEELKEAGETLSPLYPDFSLIPENLNLQAIFITHGHLDHFGGVPEIIRYLTQHDRPIPTIYGPHFATALITSKLSAENIPIHTVPMNRIKAGEPITIGNMTITAFDVFHSVPNAFGYSVQYREQEDKVVFSGDLKTRFSDPDEFYKTVDSFRSLQPISLLLLDSTNADREGWTGLEYEVNEALIQAIDQATGRVFVSLFSTHIARLTSLAKICAKAGRVFGLMGASFNDPRFACETIDKPLPNNIQLACHNANVIAVAGCQANEGSSAWQLSQGATIDGVRVQEGDTFILSASPIPGRENAVREMVVRLKKDLKANVILPESFPGMMFGYARNTTHVSGHGSSEDIAAIVKASNPRFFMPVHAGPRQADAAAQLALNNYLLLPPQIILCQDNGSSIRI